MNLILKCTFCLFIFLGGYSLLAQVGINTDNPQTMLDVKGNLSLNAAALSLNNGSNTVAGGDHTFFNVSGPTSSFKINTIQPLTNADGQLITLVNTTSNSMTLVNDDGASANSILCPNKSNLLLKGIYTTATLQYNKTLKRWLVVKYADGETYQRRIYSSVGTIDFQTDLNTFSDMGADMSIKFTPKNPIVYVNVSLSGSMFTGDPNADAHGYADFRLQKIESVTTTNIAGFTAIATDVDYLVVATPWNAKMVMYPVIVTPGQEIVLKVQWRRDGQHPYTLYCAPTSLPENSHRNITIFD